jgi:hypothetical protein
MMLPVSSQNSTNCVGAILFEGFTFGVPQIVPITMFANVSQPLRFAKGIVSESLDHILFFDPLRNPLSNATFTLVELPEPTTWSLLIVGSMFLLAVAMIRRVAGTEK